MNSNPAGPAPEPEPLTAQRRGVRWVLGQMAKKGLRPRFAAYLVLAWWAFAIIVFGVVERIVDPDTFDSIWISFWWATQTVTTVGYGDIVPEQTAGKVIGTFLMVGGLAFLGVLTGLITSAFVIRAQADLRESGEDPVPRRLDELSSQLSEMQKEISRLRQDR